MIAMLVFLKKLCRTAPSSIAHKTEAVGGSVFQRVGPDSETSISNIIVHNLSFCVDVYYKVSSLFRLPCYLPVKYGTAPSDCSFKAPRKCTHLLPNLLQAVLIYCIPIFGLPCTVVV